MHSAGVSGIKEAKTKVTFKDPVEYLFIYVPEIPVVLGEANQLI